jgi:hypothetical protein
MAVQALLHHTPPAESMVTKIISIAKDAVAGASHPLPPETADATPKPRHGAVTQITPMDRCWQAPLLPFADGHDAVANGLDAEPGQPEELSMELHAVGYNADGQNPSRRRVRHGRRQSSTI